jgi:pyruvyltransferase
MHQINVYAASIGVKFGAQPENYGDNLMTALLRGLFDVEPRYVRMTHADLIGVGSIADAYHRRNKPAWKRFLSSIPKRELHIWGSGFMNRSGEAIWPQQIKFHAVRGPLSREKSGVPELPLGDPALLLPSVWKKPQTHSEVAIIPHFATYGDFADKLSASLPKHWKLVNLIGDPENITNQIAGAEMVVSSSLHGLIVADAYNVPSILMKGDNRVKGDGFKYEDYIAFRGQDFGPPLGPAQLFSSKLVPTSPCRPSDQTIRALINAFPFN